MIIVALSVAVWSCSAFQKPRVSDIGTYSSAQHLQKIDSLEKLGLYRSARDEANQLLDRSIVGNHPGMAGKALDYSLTFSALIDDSHDAELWPRLKENVAKSAFPTKNILAAATANWLWSYYQINQWRIASRKTSPAALGDDVREWSPQTFISRVGAYLDTALTQHKALYHTDAEMVKELFSDSVACAGEQNLLELLVDKAQRFYLSHEVNTVPLEQVMDHPEDLLADIDRFQQIQVQPNERAYWHESVERYQALAAHHLRNKNEIALANLTVNRLKKYKAHLINDQSDDLHLNALESSLNQLKSPEAKAIISFGVAELYEARANQQPNIPTDSTRWYYAKALELCAEILENEIVSESIHKSCEALKSRITQMALNTITEKVILPGKPWKSTVQYRNISEVYYTVVPFDYETYRELLAIRDREEQMVKIVSTAGLRDLPHRVELNDEGDFRSHTFEMAHDSLTTGFYLMITAPTRVVGYEQANVSINPIWVSEVAWTHRQDDRQRNEFRFVHRETGAPIADLEIKVYAQSYNIYQRITELNRVLETHPDEEGYVKVIPTKKDQRLVLKVVHDDHPIWIESFYHSGHDRNATAFSRIHFFTDRSVYRPGQTVHFKGIILRYRNEERSVLSNVTEKVELMDVNSRVVQEAEFTTNDFGSFSGSFILPESGITGNYRLQTSRGSHYFSVEEYKRPTFSVSLTAPDSAHLPGDRVTFRGKAENLSGFPLQNAKVKYSVERTVEQFFWRGFGWPVPNPAEEIVAGTVFTDENGEFEVPFKAAVTKSQSAYQHWRFTVNAEVTDISGETHSAESFIRLGGAPAILHANLSSVKRSENLKSISIGATNVNGDSVAVNGMIEIFKLKMSEKPLRERLWATPDQFQLDSVQHAALFPDDAYRVASGIDNAVPEQSVFRAPFNTSNNRIISLPEDSLWNNGWYLIRMSSEIKGVAIVNEQRFTVINDSISGTLPEMLWSFVENIDYQPGDSLKLFFTGKVGMKVWLEVETKGRITDQKWVELTGEMQSVYIPVTEEAYGNFGIHLSSVYDNRNYASTHQVSVPYRHKKLKVELETVRDHMHPGAKDEWKVKVTDADGRGVSAELLAGMYDASLDALGFRNSWALNPFTNRNVRLHWNSHSSMASSYGWLFQKDWNRVAYYYPPQPCELNFGGGRFSPMYSRMNFDAVTTTGIAATAMKDEAMVQSAVADTEVIQEERTTQFDSSAPLSLRSDFSETAFFIPELTTDTAGGVTFSFSLPESVTTWRWMLLANTRDLKTGSQEGTLTASKPLMVIANPPRFVREGDHFMWTAQVVNLSEKDQDAEVLLEIRDLQNNADLTTKLTTGPVIKRVKLAAGASVAVQWPVTIDRSEGLISFKTTAMAKNFSDGEIRPIPVLPRKMLVTETMPLTIYGSGQHHFNFGSLQQSAADTSRQNHRLTFEFSANPAWYAVQALPYLMERSHESTEQVFSRMYANSLAAHIVKSKPEIAEMLKRYADSESDALLSNLEKNQSLKRVLIEETPWLMQATNETEAKRRMAVLFDEERMNTERQAALQILQAAQLADGSWSWFGGMRSDRYITQYIVEGMGRLKQLGIMPEQSKTMVNQALKYLDRVVVLAHDHKVPIENEGLSAIDVHYLYLRSFFSDITPTAETVKTVGHLWKLAENQWRTQTVFSQSMLALAAHRTGNRAFSRQIVASLNERSIFTTEQGRYWKLNNGAYWYHQPVETQSMLIALYTETGAKEQWINEMKVWLLNQKRVQNWKTTTATASACYALLMQGSDWLNGPPWPNITVGDYEIEYNEGLGGDYKVVVSPEPGSGHIKTSWDAAYIESNMASVNVQHQHDGPAWGAMYWQYFQDMDRVVAHQSPLGVKRTYFVAVQREGKTTYLEADQQKLAPGDRLVVRVELESEMDFEYVHLKERRAAGLEPVDVLSGYRFGNGPGYYLSVTDEANHFFFQRLPRGKHVLEYELRVNLSGTFSAGPAEVQCMYAPEFAAQSEGWRLIVE